jgi:hypothetical protein
MDSPMAIIWFDDIRYLYFPLERTGQILSHLLIGIELHFISFHLFNIPQIPSAVHSHVDVEIVLIIK